MRFGSLFSGIGGLDLGLERAGMECAWQVENDEYCQRVLAKHWPEVVRWGDIREFPPNADPALIEGLRVDAIVGGFPCQDISYAGAGAGLSGERSGLFFEALRVVRLLRPRIVLLENVAALLTRGLDRVHGELATLGYRTESHCIPAAAVGAPHIRDRVFVIGCSDAVCGRHGKNGVQCKESPDTKTSDRPINFCASALADTNITGPQGRYGEELPERPGQCVIGPSGSLAGFREQLAWWSVEPDVGRVAHGVPARVDRLRGLGNAVVPQVAEWIGRQIMNAVDREALSVRRSDVT